MITGNRQGFGFVLPDLGPLPADNYFDDFIFWNFIGGGLPTDYGGFGPVDLRIETWEPGFQPPLPYNTLNPPRTWDWPTLFDPFIPSGGGGTGINYCAAGYGGKCPGTCPGGTYHPYPAGDPRQDECIPFPADTAGRTRTNQQQAAQRAAAALPRTTTAPQTTGCPYPYQPARDAQGKVQLDKQGKIICVLPAGYQQASGDDSWLWLLLLALGVMAIS